jgi:cyclophilin family peptidyl-prolyl cis-trans isomerase
METNKGTITIELDAKNAPITVENFLKYVDNGHYNDTIFHRVIPDFMIQGGGFTTDNKEKPTGRGIKNEGGNGLKNARGTLAMARTSAPDSATAQFFINLVDNSFLNRDRSQDGFGYAVFGRVTEGMDIVDAIAKVPTSRTRVSEGYPSEPIVIKSLKRKAANP